MINFNENGTVTMKVELQSVEILGWYQTGLIELIQAGCLDRNQFPDGYGNALHNTLEILKASLLSDDQLAQYQRLMDSKKLKKAV